MWPMLRLLEAPVPIIAAAVVPQLAPILIGAEEVARGPGYLAVALLGAWVVLWFLDRIGKLPGRPQGERRNSAFTQSDHTMLKEIATRTQVVCELLATRDPDGVERFARFVQDSKRSQAQHAETNAMLQKILVILDERGDT